MHLFPIPKVSCVLTFSTLLLFACGQGTEKYIPPAPPEVSVSHPEKKEVTDYLEFTGNTKALESVEIRARVQGFLDRMSFEPGQKVKAGEVLFVIDPRPFRARVDQQQATLKAKKAASNLAKIKAEKAASLFSSASISELTLLEENANRDVALAQVGVAEADLEEARLQLDYTQVKSPINGRVSRNLVDLGSLVGAHEKTLLTTVVNDESVYAYFHISENDLLMLMRTYGAKEDQSPDAPCHLCLADETDFPHKGKLDFVDTQVDPGTGTLTVRALFPNDTGLLMPGLFVRLRVPLKQREALFVPNLAIGMDQAGRNVLVVNNDNVVEQRPVQVGQLVGRLRVVEKGLSEHDWVITNGMQRARPESKVNPTRESPASPVSAGSSLQTPAGK
jgi:RND family efflux transporter MFP subunit